MRKLLVAFCLIAASLCAQPKPVLGYGSNVFGWHWFGTKTAYPGYSGYIVFSDVNYSVDVTCAASGNTCDFSGSGYTPTGMETGIIVEATTMPTGMSVMREGYPPVFNACNLSGTTIQLCHAYGSPDVETWSSTGTAVKLHFMPAAKVGQHSFFIASDRASDMGFPSGTTVTWGTTDGGSGPNFTPGFISANGYPYDYGSAYQQALKYDIPSNATPGDSTITITTCDADPTVGAHTCPGGSNSTTLTFTITVTALTYQSDANEAASFPAISGLTRFTQYMTSGDGASAGGWADHWCDRSNGHLLHTVDLISPYMQGDISAVFNADQAIFYYDGGSGLHRAALWTGDTGLDACAQNLLQQSGFGNVFSVAFPTTGNYLGGYANGSGPPGYRIFPQGFSDSIGIDQRYVGPLEAIGGLMQPLKGDTTVLNGCYIGDGGIRESAYALLTMLVIDKRGLTPSADSTWKVREQRCADELIGMMNMHLDGTGRYAWIEYFLDGLTWDALEHWWQKTKDPRVLMVLPPSWTNYYSNYNLTTHIAMWNPDPVGIHCTDDNTLWYVGPVDEGCQNNTTADFTVLHNLNSHLAAFLFRITGDDTYRTQGDEVFAHALDGQDDSKGKTWGQLYKNAFNYIGWRQGWLSPEKSVQ